ncbi:MAG TPA: hypothetical protein DFS52_07905 [Myxococcales bacterium]|jgi:hypothetical protein|nr:hypothetical protein [Myxococcales bacterium]
MPKKRTISRWALARRLQETALRIAAGKPVRIGGQLVCVPDEVLLEEELETSDGETELEFEIKWPETKPPAPKRTSKRK